MKNLTEEEEEKKQKYSILYSDCGEKLEWFCFAYDAEHAAEKFWDSLNQDDAGIEILKIKRIFVTKAS